MKKLGFAFGAAIAVAAISGPATAASNKPVHAAETGSGSLCIVRAGPTDPYMVDPSCSYHTVVKNNKDGSPRSFKYQDKGRLQPGQTAPDQAVRIDISNANCTGSEMITPSGNYSSNLDCNY